jgi:four helix bundle protein
MQSYRNLRVSGRARELIRETYRLTATFPREERFGLIGQMRRAAISTALNIAEGCSRRTTKELIRFLEISIGSALELEVACDVAVDLDYAKSERIKAVYDVNAVFQKETAALIGSLRARVRAGTRK